MTRRALLLATGLLLGLAAPTSRAEGLELPHFEYEGELGPEAWGSLDGAYELCSVGTQQSPIDLGDAQAVPEALNAIEFAYNPSLLTLLNNGHTIQANYDPGSTIVLDSQPFDLLQLHFHTPSEHVLNGKRFDAELHFVHRDPEAKGFLAVVGAFIEVGEENPAFNAILENAPTEAGEPEAFSELIDAADMLPESTHTFRYLGSLTTPPCSQGVRWNVLTEPITMSRAQLETLAELMGTNNRPLQPLGSRTLLSDTP